MKKYKIDFLISTIIILVTINFMSCKKYPENTLWLKSPKKMSPVHGYIKAYTVNGIDSLELLNVYYEQTIWHSYGPYNKLIKDVKEEYFNLKTIKKGKADIACDLFYNQHLLTTWASNGKSINIRSGVDIDYYKRNIFVVSGLNWDIIYLDKNRKSKIKTTYNGNVYEITFDY